MSVASLCRGGARRAPERNAVEWDGGESRSPQLDRRTEALARHLQRQTVRPGRRASGIYCDNRVEWIEAYVAAHKAGIPVVPINHRYRGARSSHILAEAGARARDPRRDGRRRPRGPARCWTAVRRWPSATSTSGRPLASATRVEPLRDARTSSSTPPGTTALPKGVDLHARHPGGVRLRPPDRDRATTPPTASCSSRRSRTGRRSRCCSARSPRRDHAPAAPVQRAEGLAAAVAERGITALTGVPTAIKDLLGLKRRSENASMPGSATCCSRARACRRPAARADRELFPNARLRHRVRQHRGRARHVPRPRAPAQHPRSCGRALQGVEVRLVGRRRRDGRDGRAGRDARPRAASPARTRSPPATSPARDGRVVHRRRRLAAHGRRRT